MPQQFGQIVERIGAVQFASMNEAHKEVSHVRPVQGLIKEPILAVQNGFLQGPFHDVIIEGRAGLPQEKRQLRPVIQQIGDGFAQADVINYK